MESQVRTFDRSRPSDGTRIARIEVESERGALVRAIRACIASEQEGTRLGEMIPYPYRTGPEWRSLRIATRNFANAASRNGRTPVQISTDVRSLLAAFPETAAPSHGLGNVVLLWVLEAFCEAA